jgi:hypothetical protein
VRTAQSAGRTALDVKLTLVVTSAESAEVYEQRPRLMRVAGKMTQVVYLMVLVSDLARENNDISGSWFGICCRSQLQ